MSRRESGSAGVPDTYCRTVNQTMAQPSRRIVSFSSAFSSYVCGRTQQRKISAPAKANNVGGTAHPLFSIHPLSSFISLLYIHTLHQDSQTQRHQSRIKRASYDTISAVMSQVATSSAPTGSGSAGRRANIPDIRRSKDGFNVRRDIEIGLQPSNGREKPMPPLLTLKRDQQRSI